MTSTPRNDAIMLYLEEGFIEILTDSGTGSRVLISTEQRRAVKINEDPAYHAFAEYAKNNRSDHLPEIFRHKVHERVDQFNGHWFTITEMEMLEPLSQEEVDSVSLWSKEAKINKAPTGAEDTLDLTPTFQALRAQATKSNHNLDVFKSTNYMARARGGKRIIVFTDPFN